MRRLQQHGQKLLVLLHEKRAYDAVVAAVCAPEMGETLKGIATKTEAIQLGEDVPGQEAPPLLQSPLQFRKAFAYEAMEEIIMRSTKLRRHGPLRRRFFTGWRLFGMHARSLVVGPRKVLTCSIHDKRTRPGSAEAERRGGEGRRSERRP